MTFDLNPVPCQELQGDLRNGMFEGLKTGVFIPPISKLQVI